MAEAVSTVTAEPSLNVAVFGASDSVFPDALGRAGGALHHSVFLLSCLLWSLNVRSFVDSDVDSEFCDKL